MLPKPSKPKTKETVNRTFTAILLALLLCIPITVAAAPSRAYVYPSAYESDADTCSKEQAAEMLSMFVAHAKGRRNGIVVANWYLHPDGFAFQIPKGLVLTDKHRGISSLFSSYRDALYLVDPAGEDQPFQTLFTLSITSEDKRLHTMQRGDAEHVFSGQFDRFSLLSFTRVLICGEDGIHMTFLTGRVPRLQVQQYMFVKNGQTYISTIASENSLFALLTACRQFDTFYRTLFFLDDV